MKLFVDRIERTSDGYRLCLRTEAPDSIGDVVVKLHGSAEGPIKGIIPDAEFERRLPADRRPIMPLIDVLWRLEDLQGVEMASPDEGS